MKKLFVGNFPASTREEDFQALLTEFGVVRQPNW